MTTNNEQLIELLRRQSHIQHAIGGGEYLDEAADAITALEQRIKELEQAVEYHENVDKEYAAKIGLCEAKKKNNELQSRIAKMVEVAKGVPQETDWEALDEIINQIITIGEGE